MKQYSNNVFDMWENSLSHEEASKLIQHELDSEQKYRRIPPLFTKEEWKKLQNKLNHRK